MRNNSDVTSSPPRGNPTRLLGAYLIGLCIYSIGIYRWPGGPPFILDPRAGIAVLLNTRSSLPIATIHVIEWVCTGWLILLADVIFFTGKLVKLYLVSEVLLALPTAFYIGALAIGHGGHFAPGLQDLAVTVLLFSAFSVIPIGLALRSPA
jgi:hypothetical protein